MDVIFDIDGTLSDVAHRRHLLAGPGRKDWAEFFRRMADDPPRPHIVTLARMLHGAGARLILASGRFERHRATTVAWLTTHAGDWLAERPLFLRADNDHRSDDVVKVEYLEKMRAAGFDPVMAVDDRDRVVRAWRAAGLVCLQCAEGAF
ncbi:MAG: HAD family acid phosphatase [Alphaproteobacteria bacterium]